MKTIKTILVPTDFSISADSAVRYALKLAEEFKASIILYHSFIPFESGFYPIEQSIKENLETEKKLIKRLDEIKRSLLKLNNKVPVSIHVQRGPESKQIIKFSKKKHIDLIVMGTKGASGLKEVLIGSFTADVIANSSCPVLAIPKKFKFKIPEKITYTSDYHTKDIHAINFLSIWNELFKSKINILHIDDGEFTLSSEEEEVGKYKQRIEKKFKLPITFQHIAAKDISKAILHTTFNDKTDILAMSPIKREGIWNRLFHVSITKSIANHIRIPLLTIPG